jgi:hypothetical protein
VAYPGLASQFAADERIRFWAQQATKTNYWDKIFDFSPAAAGATPNWTPLPGCDPDGRWCELTIAAEGLNGGTVTENRASEPTVAGCECPCPAQDGTLYVAEWYNPADTAAAADNAAASAAAAKETTADISIGLGDTPTPATSASDGGLLCAVRGWFSAVLRRLTGSKPSANAYPPAETPAGKSDGKSTQVCTVS